MERVNAPFEKIDDQSQNINQVAGKGAQGSTAIINTTLNF